MFYRVQSVNSKGMQSIYFTAQRMKFSIKNFFSKYDQIRQIRRKLRIWSHLLNKSLKKLHLCGVFCSFNVNNWIKKGPIYFSILYFILGR